MMGTDQATSPTGNHSLLPTSSRPGHAMFVATCLAILSAVWAANEPIYTRTCRDSDWHFAFGTCREEMGGSTEEYYEFDRHQQLKHRPGVELKDFRTQLKCLDCAAGKFSLGGGLLISGVAGDWHKSWPVGLRSSCSYQLPDGSMRHGKGSTTGLSGTCEMQVLAPESMAGRYTIRSLLPAKPALSKRLQPPVARIVLAPGDRRLCNTAQRRGAATLRRCTRPKRGEIAAGLRMPRLVRLLGWQAAKGSGGPGAKSPGQARCLLCLANAALPIYQRFWLLAAMGGCPESTKANVAAAVGAEEEEPIIQVQLVMVHEQEADFLLDIVGKCGKHFNKLFAGLPQVSQSNRAESVVLPQKFELAFLSAQWSTGPQTGSGKNVGKNNGFSVRVFMGKVGCEETEMDVTMVNNGYGWLRYFLC
eukprot:Skav232986  [mRNA]  locus=scaffold1735:575513:584697:+ [translate_table: standard]